MPRLFLRRWRSAPVGTPNASSPSRSRYARNAGRSAAIRAWRRCSMCRATCAGAAPRRPLAKTRIWSACWPRAMCGDCKARSATCWQRSSTMPATRSAKGRATTRRCTWAGASSMTFFCCRSRWRSSRRMPARWCRPTTTSIASLAMRPGICLPKCCAIDGALTGWWWPTMSASACCTGTTGWRPTRPMLRRCPSMPGWMSSCRRTTAPCNCGSPSGAGASLWARVARCSPAGRGEKSGPACLELPADDCAMQLRLALERGAITLAKIDEIVARVLKEKFRLGLFEQTFEDRAEPPRLRSPECVATALEAARQSLVVLDNRSGILPLAPAARQRIAVIGPTAADPMGQLSGYSYHAHSIAPDEVQDTSHIVTPLQGIQALFGASLVRYEQGCQILEQRSAGAPVFPGDVDDAGKLPRQASPASRRTDPIPAPAKAARSADLAIVCVGDLAGLFQRGTIAEGSDTDSLSLPGVQQQLLEAVVATGTPTIVVLSGGRTYNLGGLEDKLAAFVMAFAGGQEGGRALAEVLAGRVEPSGRLTLSTPVNVGAMPYYYNHKLKSGGTPIALHFGSPYPFGHGLSYTRFEYRRLAVATPEVPIEDGQVELSFELANVGERSGIEVVQLYVRDCQASLVRPVRELKAFRRVALEPGHSARVTFRVPVDMLGFTGMTGQRIVEPGLFDLALGASSADIRLRAQVQVCGPLRTLGRDWRMESHSEVQPL